LVVSGLVHDHMSLQPAVAGSLPNFLEISKPADRCS